jgi:hypothetical protein
MKYPLISVILILVFGSGCRRSDKIIGLNENIHHDDFNYRVTALEKRKIIRADTLQMNAGGIFYIVTFEVENNAKRVGHIWNNHIAFLVSENGDRYENNLTAQRLLNMKEPFEWHSTYNTGHGSTEQTRLIFDVPGNPAHLYLKVHGETLMGDVFDLNRFKHIKIKLE